MFRLPLIFGVLFAAAIGCAASNGVEFRKLYVSSDNREKANEMLALFDIETSLDEDDLHSVCVPKYQTASSVCILGHGGLLPDWGIGFWSSSEEIDREQLHIEQNRDMMWRIRQRDTLTKMFDTIRTGDVRFEWSFDGADPNNVDSERCLMNVYCDCIFSDKRLRAIRQLTISVTDLQADQIKFYVKSDGKYALKTLGSPDNPK